ncbi:MAG: J domain-containing protein [bacterium]
MDFIKGVPKLNPDLSYNSLNLTPVEGYLLSRIDGVSSVEDIASTSGLPFDQAIEIVKSLWNKKVFSIDGIEVQETGSEKQNNIALTQEERVNIEKMLELVENGNYYQMLSVPLNVKPSEVKIRFFELSKVYHPDRYFKKDIGIYRDKLNTIFKKLSEAYEVLYDPNKKRLYDATLANTGLKTRNNKETRRLNYNRTDNLHTDETVKITKPEQNVSKKMDVDHDTSRTAKLETTTGKELTIDQRIASIKEKLNKNMLELASREIDTIKDIKDSRVLLLMAEYYLKKNDLLTAKEYAQMAVEYDQHNIEAYNILGSIYMKFKLYRNALKVYENIKGIHPDDTSVDSMISNIKSLIED